MLRRARRASGNEAIFAVGMTVIGLLNQDPIAALAGTVGGIGGNLIAGLLHDFSLYWKDNWVTEHGALNHDIANALGRAFSKAIGKLEAEWKQDRYYKFDLGQDDQQLTLGVLRGLREDAKRIFSDMNRLKAALDDNEIPLLLHQGEAYANRKLGSALEEYLTQSLHGHDDKVISFVRERLIDEWLECFREELVDGTRAWRAYQQLWQQSLVRTVVQIGHNTVQVKQDTAQILDSVRQLQAWTQKQGSIQPLESPSQNIHSYVQDVLDSLRVGAIVEELLDEDPAKRTTAAQSLLALKNSFTVPILARRLMTEPELLEPDPTVRYWLACALGEIGGEEACTALRRAKAQETNIWALKGIEEGLRAANCEAGGVKH
jgi:hypothetical protein